MGTSEVLEIEADEENRGSRALLAELRKLHSGRA